MSESKLKRATYTIEETAVVLGIGRSACYDLAKRDELPVPVIRIGARRIVVPKPALDRLLAGQSPEPSAQLREMSTQ